MGFFANQDVAYKRDPSLYGHMHVSEVAGDMVAVELHDGTTEVFTSAELVIAATVYGVPASNLGILATRPDVPDAPPVDMS